MAGIEDPSGADVNAIKIVAVVLILAGVVGLAHRTFTYTETTHEAKVGPVEVTVKDKETVYIPVWASVGAILGGAALLILGARKK
jgi:hypothetical protein